MDKLTREAIANSSHELQHQITEVLDKHHRLKDTVSSIQNVDIFNIKNAIQDLYTKVNKNTTDISSLNSYIETTHNKCYNLWDQLDDFKIEMNRRIESLSESIECAHQGYLSHNIALGTLKGELLRLSNIFQQLADQCHFMLGETEPNKESV